MHAHTHTQPLLVAIFPRWNLPAGDFLSSLTHRYRVKVPLGLPRYLGRHVWATEHRVNDVKFGWTTMDLFSDNIFKDTSSQDRPKLLVFFLRPFHKLFLVRPSNQHHPYVQQVQTSGLDLLNVRKLDSGGLKPPESRFLDKQSDCFQFQQFSDLSFSFPFFWASI